MSDPTAGGGGAGGGGDGGGGGRGSNPEKVSRPSMFSFKSIDKSADEKSDDAGAAGMGPRISYQTSVDLTTGDSTEELTPSRIGSRTGSGGGGGGGSNASNLPGAGNVQSGKRQSLGRVKSMKERFASQFSKEVRCVLFVCKQLSC